MSDSAIVREKKSEATELIEEARQVVETHSDCFWEIGRLAGEWKEDFNGSDESFASQVGVSHQEINKCRRVYSVFAARREEELTLYHLKTALVWTVEDLDGANAALDWAVENNASVSQMKDFYGSDGSVVEEQEDSEPDFFPGSDDEYEDAEEVETDGDESTPNLVDEEDEDEEVGDLEETKKDELKHEKKKTEAFCDQLIRQVDILNNIKPSETGRKATHKILSEVLDVVRTW